MKRLLLFLTALSLTAQVTPFNTNVKFLGYVDSSGATATSPFTYSTTAVLNGACSATPPNAWVQIANGVLLYCNALTGTYQAQTLPLSGNLVGDVTGAAGANTVVKVNGASVPASAGATGTNSNGQIISQSASTLYSFLGPLPSANLATIPSGTGTVSSQEINNSPRPLLNTWLGAVANAPSAIANAVVIGDSTSILCGQGTGPTNCANVGINVLTSAYGATSHGAGLIPVGNNPGSQNINWTLSGTWTTIGDFGPTQGSTGAFNSVYSATGASNTLTLAAQPMDTLLFYGETTTGSTGCALSIDSGAQTATVTETATGSPVAFETSITITAGLGKHTVQVAPLSSGSCLIYGVQPTTGTSGISVHNLSHGFARSEAWGSNTTNELAYAALIPGSVQIVIIPLGINDSINGTGTTPTQYQTYVQNVITFFKTLNPQVSVLIMDENPTSAGYGSQALTQTQIYAIEQSLAASNNAQFASLQDRFGSYANLVALGWMNGVTHPNDAGQLAIGAYYVSLLAPAGGLNIPNLTINPPSASYVLATGSEAVSLAGGTPVFSSSTLQSTVTMSANITNFTLPSGTDGQQKLIEFCENSTGGFGVTGQPSNVVGKISLNTLPSACTVISLSYGAGKSTWFVTGPPTVPVTSEAASFAGGTPTFSNLVLQSTVTMSANITNFTLAAGIDGQEKIITFCENSTGNFIVSGQPSNVAGMFSLNTLPSACTSTLLVYSQGKTSWFVTGPPTVPSTSEAASFSGGTPTFSTAVLQSTVSMTGDITTFTLASGIDGQQKIITFCENSTGGYRVSPPANVSGTININPTPSLCTPIGLTYSVGKVLWLVNGPPLPQFSHHFYIAASTSIVQSTMLGAVYYEGNTATITSVEARLSGTTTCTVAPTVAIMDLGTSATTIYASATVLTTLVTGTSAGAYESSIPLRFPIQATHRMGMGFAGGQCTISPVFDITVSLQ